MRPKSRREIIRRNDAYEAQWMNVHGRRRKKPPEPPEGSTDQLEAGGPNLFTVGNKGIGDTANQLFSANGKYKLLLEEEVENGSTEFLIYEVNGVFDDAEDWTEIWRATGGPHGTYSPTNGKGAFKMEPQGNLIVYRPNSGPTWHTDTDDPSHSLSRLVLENNGQLNIYSTIASVEQIIWNSVTGPNPLGVDI